MGVREDNVSKQDLQSLKEEIIHQFHIISEGLIDQIRLLSEGHVGIIDRLNKTDAHLDRMEKEDEHQHSETRALVKLSFSEIDQRLSNLESQVKDLQEWKKRVEARLER